MQILLNILLVIIGVLLFGFIIFFHEFGHYLFAKLSGIRVNEFALGMGPKIFKFTKGETTYSLRAFPIGGFCAMEGEDEESDDERAFGNKPVWRRLLVVVAGGVFNIFLGFFMLIGINSQADLFATSTIIRFEEDSALEAAGIQEWDVIKEVDGYAVYTGRDLSFALAMSDPDSIDFVVERNGEKLTFSDVKMNSSTGEDGKSVINFDFIVYGEEKTVLSTLKTSAFDTYSMIRMVVESLKGLFTGRFGLNDMAGPVGTAQAITQAAEQGLQRGFWQAVSNIFTMIILITVNLGIVNLLPLPALDGGRLLFLIWEGITRKPVPAKYEGYIHAAGFVLLIGLSIVLTFNDVLRIIRG